MAHNEWLEFSAEINGFAIHCDICFSLWSDVGVEGGGLFDL